MRLINDWWWVGGGNEEQMTESEKKNSERKKDKQKWNFNRQLIESVSAKIDKQK